MSSIHYKFRATLEYKTLAFDGLSILAADLKREICNKENIKAEAFDLILQNAHTKRQYASDEQIPRNSSIIVQRVPKEDGEKLPKIQGVNTGMVQRSDASLDSAMNVTGHIMQSEFDKLTEEERLSHIKNVSTHKYDASNYQKRPTGALTGPPPPTYTCNRCHQPGHWFKNCPLLNQKRTTGIPSQELMETTPDDPQAMLHPSGKYVIPIMHWKARQHKKNVEETPVLEKVPPKELICPLCHHLFKDAVVTTCCGASFCADCISQRLLESEDRHCPGDNCNKTQVSVDSLVPNKMLRQMVSTWEAGSSSEGHERIRIGLLPSSNLQHNASMSTAGLSPAPVPTSQPNIAVPTSVPQNITPSMSVPPPPIHIPTSFTQPPPNMQMMMPVEPLAPPGTSPMVPAMPAGPMHPVQSTLPPIPGVGMIDTMYNRPSLSVNNGSQFMDVWEAFLKRNDKSSKTRDREYRRRKRSRERRRSRSASEDRKRSRRARDERRERDRSKDRAKRRDYEAKDSKKASYKRSNTDETAENEPKRRREKKEDHSPEPNDEIKEKGEEPLDEEAAIDDALKEVEQLKMLNKTDDGNAVDVDMEPTPVQASKEPESAVESSEKETASPHVSPEVHKSSESESAHSVTQRIDTSPGNRSSDSESTHGKSDGQEKPDQDGRNKHKTDPEKEKPKKEKKAKKHKKDKRHKKDKLDETEEERKERKRIKKEKKEKKKREKEEKDKHKEKELHDKDKKKERRRSGSEDEREHKRKDDRHKDHKETRRKDDKEKDAHKREKDRHHHEKERSSKHSKENDKREEKKKEDTKRDESSKTREENSRADRKDKDKKPSKLDRLVDAKVDLSSKAAVIDEKQIREHFSPPPSLLQTKKITLNI